MRQDVPCIARHHRTPGTRLSSTAFCACGWTSRWKTKDQPKRSASVMYPVACVNVSNWRLVTQVGFFVHAEHNRGAGRVQVESDDVGYLAGELRIAAELERVLAMRSQPFLPPQLRHVVPGDGDVGGTADIFRHLPARPVRQTCLRRWARAGEREDPGADPGGYLFAWRSPGPVDQTADAVRFVPADPQIDRRSGHSRQRRDLLLRGTVGMPQHDPRRVAMFAGTSRLFTSADNSPAVSSLTPQDHSIRLDQVKATSS